MTLNRLYMTRHISKTYNNGRQQAKKQSLYTLMITSTHAHTVDGLWVTNVTLSLARRVVDDVAAVHPDIMIIATARIDRHSRTG